MISYLIISIFLIVVPSLAFSTRPCNWIFVRDAEPVQRFCERSTPNDDSDPGIDTENPTGSNSAEEDLAVRPSPSPTVPSEAHPSREPNSVMSDESVQNTTSTTDSSTAVVSPEQNSSGIICVERSEPSANGIGRSKVQNIVPDVRNTIKVCYPK